MGDVYLVADAHNQTFKMAMAAENLTTLVLSLVALGTLIWGYARSRPYGRMGLLAWLQSVVLMLPWLMFFGLFALGIYVSFVVVILLFVAATGIYIYLGKQLREAGQSEQIRQRLEKTFREEEAAKEAHKDAHAAMGIDVDATRESEDGSEPRMPLDEPLPTPIPPEDLQTVKGIFGIDTFFATETIPYQQGAIFKGNLRGEPIETQAKLASSLAEQVGDRYRLYLINGPEDKPVVVVLPASADPVATSTPQKILSVILLVATTVTALERGGLQYNFDVFAEPNRWTETLAIGLPLMLIMLAHELGHWFIAKRYDVKLAWPFFLPAWQLGSFGALTRIESILPNRTVLFDIAFAGPAVGGLMSLVTLLVGLFLSGETSTLPLPVDVLEGSMLVGVLSRTILGNSVQAAVVNIHPLVVVGWLGLVITALNILPAGQLDGGRMVQAIYGRKLANRTSVISLIALAVVSLANPVALYWAVLVLFLQRQPERPSQNELTEPDDTRAALCLLALFLMLTVLLPLSPSLAGQLGIGVDAPSLLPL